MHEKLALIFYLLFVIFKKADFEELMRYRKNPQSGVPGLCYILYF